MKSFHPRIAPRKEVRNSDSVFARPTIINSDRFSERPKVLLASDGPVLIIRCMYYAFIASIPFEALDVGIGSGHFTLPKMVGYAFLVCTLLQPSLCFRSFPKAFWCFVAYIWAFAALGVLEESTRSVFVRLLTYIQMVILFLLSYNLMRYEKIVKGTLLTLAASCISLAIPHAFGTTPVMEGERFTVMNQDPNTFASVLSLGLLALVGLAHGRKEIDSRLRLLAWFGFGVLAMAIVSSGSRGSLVALVIGLLALLLKDKSFWSKVRVALLVLLAIGSLTWISYQSETIRMRWEKTFHEGSLANREKIYPTAWKMFLEKPLVGWGPESHQYELGYRLGSSKDLNPHNLYLWILLETGLLGAIPFFMGMWFCLQEAWKARSGMQGVLPLAMLLCIIVINMNITWHYRKLFWVILAYALASSTYVGLRAYRFAKH